MDEERTQPQPVTEPAEKPAPEPAVGAAVDDAIEPASWATAVVIPCYNEAERLDVDAFVDFATSRPWLELLFVDDGSDDATGAMVEAMKGRVPERIRRLSLRENRGKSEAVRRGILAAIEGRSHLVGFWDADLATPLADIDAFRARFERQPELQILMGSRVKLMGRPIERSALRHYFGRVSATAVSCILRIPVYDTQCGAKLFRVNAGLPALFAEPYTSRWAFDVEILARWLIHRDVSIDVHRALCEAPVSSWTDVPGSKLTAGDVVRAPADLWRIWRRYGGGIKERERQRSSPGESPG